MQQGSARFQWPLRFAILWSFILKCLGQMIVLVVGEMDSAHFRLLTIVTKNGPRLPLSRPCQLCPPLQPPECKAWEGSNIYFGTSRFFVLSKADKGPFTSVRMCHGRRLFFGNVDLRMLVEEHKFEHVWMILRHFISYSQSLATSCCRWKTPTTQVMIIYSPMTWTKQQILARMYWIQHCTPKSSKKRLIWPLHVFMQ